MSKKTQGDSRPSDEFMLCVDRYDCTLKDIVRHLARISASKDYADFHNQQNHDLMKAEQKEPKP